MSGLIWGDWACCVFLWEKGKDEDEDAIYTWRFEASDLA